MTDQLQNPFNAPKTYMAILICLLYHKKIPAIPLLLVDGKFVSDFCEKVNLFNILFHQYVQQYRQYKIQVFYYLFYVD